jgi:hypothetical protein
MKVKLTVNARDLDKELKSSISRKNNTNTVKNNLKISTGEMIERKFKSMKREMIADFKSLPVTKEIMAGPRSSNLSGTLGGYGNLFSFIGFESNSQPIKPIIALLETTNIVFTKIRPNGSAKVSVVLPSPQDIFQVTPLPWATGISWAERIEVGLSGLGFYLNEKSSYSRSGAGIQGEEKVRGGGFRNTPYISSFLKKWQSKFLQLSR